MTTLPLATSDPILLPALSLAKRELVRFLRQRNRIVGALLTPVLFWLLIGGGIGRSFDAPGIPGGSHFFPFFFPGTVVMILLFTAIFSTISVIEDRREGFLQSVLVAPVPRLAIVLGKVLGGTALAFGQGLLFLLAAPLVGIPFSIPAFLLTCLIMLILSFALTAMGFCIAWRMSSTQGFHAIMNLLLMPMWFMSGALFPSAGAWKPIAWIMMLNPLTYGLAALRRAIYLGQEANALPSWPLSIGITIAFAVVMLALATRIAQKQTTADLQ